MMKRILCLMSALSLALPALGNPPTMVHVHYKGVNKLSVDGDAYIERLKKSCDESRKSLPQSVPPFKLVGNPKDAESYSEDVYISPENGYHATYSEGYKLQGTTVICEYHVVPYQKKTILYYRQRSSYKFDSFLPKGEQWVRDELPSAKVGKLAAKSLIGFWGFTVQATGKKDKIANLFCEVGELTTPQPAFKGTACVWRSKPEERMNFLGYPLELILSSQMQVAKGSTDQQIADSVNLKEAYNPSVFEVPSTVKNMPFYADEPNYTAPENDDPDLDCKAEKKRTGINPCASKAEYAKWCAAAIKSTGKNPCIMDDGSGESDGK